MELDEMMQVVKCKYCDGFEYYGEIRMLDGKSYCRECYKREYEKQFKTKYIWDDLDGYIPTIKDYLKQLNHNYDLIVFKDYNKTLGFEKEGINLSDFKNISFIEQSGYMEGYSRFFFNRGEIEVSIKETGRDYFLPEQNDIDENIENNFLVSTTIRFPSTMCQLKEVKYLIEDKNLFIYILIDMPEIHNEAEKILQLNLFIPK